MSKHPKRGHGRGVIAIALFDMAAALRRWAAAQERIAGNSELSARTQVDHLRLLERDLEFRQSVKDDFVELPAKVAELREILLAAVPKGVFAEDGFGPVPDQDER